MPEQPRRLRVVFRPADEPNPDGARADILSLLAQGIASHELAAARAAAEARLGRALRHEPDPVVELSPVEALRRRALRDL